MTLMRQYGKDVGFGLKLMGSDIAFATRLMLRSVNRLNKVRVAASGSKWQQVAPTIVMGWMCLRS